MKEKKDIEVLPDESSLFRIKRPEGTIVKLKDAFWVSENEYVECEHCNKVVIDSEGWRNVTYIVEATKRFFGEVEQN